jgi:hypothetical protein
MEGLTNLVHGPQGQRPFSAEKAGQLARVNLARLPQVVKALATRQDRFFELVCHAFFPSLRTFRHDGCSFNLEGRSIDLCQFALYSERAFAVKAKTPYLRIDKERHRFYTSFAF